MSGEPKTRIIDARELREQHAAFELEAPTLPYRRAALLSPEEPAPVRPEPSRLRAVVCAIVITALTACCALYVTRRLRAGHHAARAPELPLVPTPVATPLVVPDVPLLELTAPRLRVSLREREFAPAVQPLVLRGGLSAARRTR